MGTEDGDAHPRHGNKRTAGGGAEAKVRDKAKD